MRFMMYLLLFSCVMATGSHDAMADEDKEHISRDERDGPHRILVMLHLPPPHFRPDTSYAGNYSNDIGRNARRRIAEELAETYGLKLIDDWPMPALNVDCYVMEESSLTIKKQALDNLSKDVRVAWVQPINTFHGQATNDPFFPVQPGTKYWQLAEIRKITTGRKVLVAVIDSGVDVTHPDLNGQVLLKENFVDGNPYTAETHGTGIAGVIAARAGNGVGIEGVAPDAHIMALRACWQESSTAINCNSFTLGKAINFAVTQGAHVINLSLSGPTDRLLRQLLDVALARNIKIVGAIDHHRIDGGFPASHPGVFAVSDEKSSLLNNTVLIAPGRDIPTTEPGSRWNFVSGSSYSAAHISGMMALISELRPTATPSQVRKYLVVDSVNQDPQLGGYVNLCATVRRITNQCACSCLETSTSTTAATHK
ncbi:S8 family peptidase [Undibacterium sp. Xuan67W]|uniref:S8 family peptidase n=1 Tax=Undibacterium sp. Xuan67W TaxID=3413057 RepID=UPI003BF35F8F